MIARAGKYIDAILTQQKADGWICPCTEEARPTYDTWAVQLISKVLTVYYSCSRDERIPGVIYNVLKNYYELLKNGTVHLFSWGKARWYECFIAINFLYERCKEDWIPDLAKILFEQGQDYNEVTERWKRPLNQWTFETHIVNIAMMLKSEAVSHEILGKDYTDNAEYLRTILADYNGTPVGSFTGDECLSGLSPIQGTELCAIVEQMYSYEQLFAVTGDNKWAERLELLAFNALPATISDDMWTHQYDQQSNQIACIRFPGKPVYRTNSAEAGLFGLEPNYGCCTANFNQGWPKFALSAFMHDADTVVNVLPVPGELKTDAQTITVKTNYPFQNNIIYSIDAKNAFTFIARIPSFAKNLTVDGVPADSSGNLSFALSAGDHREIIVQFDVDPVLKDRPHDLKTVQWGSLVFSLPISHELKMYEYEKNGVERKFPYCDYELIPTSDWNYGFCDSPLKPEYHEVDAIPFSSKNPPVTVKVKARKINWGFEDGYAHVCAKVPESRIPIGEEESITLYPYGCAKLRMTELPLLK